jgi:hypothetical protein
MYALFTDTFALPPGMTRENYTAQQVFDEYLSDWPGGSEQIYYDLNEAREALEEIPVYSEMRYEGGKPTLAGQLAYIQEVDADEEYEISERGEILAFRAAPCEAE